MKNDIVSKLRQKIKEADSLRERLTAANKEIIRMHEVCAQTRKAAVDSRNQLVRICTALHISAAMELGTEDADGNARVLTIPYIDADLVDRYDLKFQKDPVARTLTLRVTEKKD